MTLAALKAEIERLIGTTPYTKEEVVSVLTAEQELDFEETLAYMAALDYLKDRKKGDYKKLQKVFLKKKADMFDKYGSL